ncbi:hypothetical protein BC826DRAFT_402586 [Russula brevipes]|nr:hypothetical protein BC826DRAFT_402586 [Russula brevipes]
MAGAQAHDAGVDSRGQQTELRGQCTDSRGYSRHLRRSTMCGASGSPRVFAARTNLVHAKRVGCGPTSGAFGFTVSLVWLTASRLSPEGKLPCVAVHDGHGVKEVAMSTAGILRISQLSLKSRCVVAMGNSEGRVGMLGMSSRGEPCSDSSVPFRTSAQLRCVQYPGTSLSASAARSELSVFLPVCRCRLAMKCAPAVGVRASTAQSVQTGAAWCAGYPRARPPQGRRRRLR